MSAEKTRTGRLNAERPPRPRTANLSADRVHAILRLIDGLPSGSGWAELTTATREELKLPYTRQALSAHPVIRLALKARKHGTSKGSSRRPPASASSGAGPDHPCHNCAKSKRTAEMLIEKHLVWIYNAHSHGLTQEDLDKPLPPPGRAE